jgi:hypothetical protein
MTKAAAAGPLVPELPLFFGPLEVRPDKGSTEAFP